MGAPVRRHGDEPAPGHDQHARGDKSLLQSRGLDIPDRPAGNFEASDLIHHLFHRSNAIELCPGISAGIFAPVRVRRFSLACRPAASSTQLCVRPVRLARDKSVLRPYADAQQLAAYCVHLYRRGERCQSQLPPSARSQLAPRHLHLPVDPAERSCRAVLQRWDAARIAPTRRSDFFSLDVFPAGALAAERRHLRARMVCSVQLSCIFRRCEGLFGTFFRLRALCAGLSLAGPILTRFARSRPA